MKRRALAFLGAIAMVTMTTQASAEDRLSLHRLDADLRPGRQVSWPAGGRLLGPVHVRPDGRVVALIEPRPGALQVVEWSIEGKEAARRPLEGAAGKAATSRLSADGTLTVVTGAAILKLGADGRALARRSLTLRAAEALAVRAAPSGAWFAFKDRLVFAGFEGDPIVKPAPISAGAAEIPFLGMAVSRQDECLLAEGRSVTHRLSGNPGGDTTRQVVLTLVDRKGQVRGRRVLGEIGTEREWFWSEKQPSNPSFLPNHFGLVRTRHRGWTDLEALAEAGHGGFLAVLSEGGVMVLKGLDAELEELFSRALRSKPPFAISPPWTKGLLLAAGERTALAFDERGGSERRGAFREVEGGPERDSLRVTVGQGPQGEWLVVLY